MADQVCCRSFQACPTLSFCDEAAGRSNCCVSQYVLGGSLGCSNQCVLCSPFVPCADTSREATLLLRDKCCVLKYVLSAVFFVGHCWWCCLGVALVAPLVVWKCLQRTSRLLWLVCPLVTLTQAVQFFKSKWFELYVHSQTTIALCDVMLQDWVHYLSTTLRILDPGLLHAALVALHPPPSVNPGTPPAITNDDGAAARVSAHQRLIEAQRRLNAFVANISRVSRQQLRKRHTRCVFVHHLSCCVWCL